MFITLYGVNNIGKSTHTRMLADRLKKEGYKATYLKYPIYDIEPTGTYLNKALRSGEQKITEEELQLWFALNRHQYQRTLRDYLEKGIIVVAEDYVGTAIAWGWAKGADKEWLEYINKYLIKEDLAILIEGERTLKAIEPGHIHETDYELTNLVRKNLLKLADEKDWKRVELQPTKPETHALIWDVVKDRLQ